MLPGNHFLWFHFPAYLIYPWSHLPFPQEMTQDYRCLNFLVCSSPIERLGKPVTFLFWICSLPFNSICQSFHQYNSLLSGMLLIFIPPPDVFETGHTALGWVVSRKGERVYEANLLALSIFWSSEEGLWGILLNQPSVSTEVKVQMVHIHNGILLSH